MPATKKEVAVVRPHPETAIQYKQSRLYRNLPKLPMRIMICGRSAAGKGTLISSLVTDQFADTFECVYIFSTTVEMDPLWKRVVKYIREELQQPGYLRSRIPSDRIFNL